MKRFATLGTVAIGVWLLLAAPALAVAPAVGPPYPPAVTGQRVYDYAGIFSPATISTAESIIAGIERRTGAQVAVYTQVKPESDTLDLANADARALMDQWGVGRKGFDDGLVILFDMRSLFHGEVSLYAGAGYRAAFLSDSDRQTIFDNDMKPLLADGDLDGGLLAGLRDIDANATPDHASALERGRQINAVAVVVALLIGFLLVLAAVLRWLLHGRDPVYIDDSSILMPAPPAKLTPAMATLLLSDRKSDRTITAGLLDLAAKGAIAFKQERRQVGDNPLHMGITYLGAGREPLQDPERELLDGIVDRSKSFDNYIGSNRLYRLRSFFDAFGEQLETAAVANGWLTEPPGKAVYRWARIGCAETSIAIVVGIVWLVFMASMLFVLTAGLIVAGVVTLSLAYFMPARTRQGAMLYAMLSAYKRTLAKTMSQSNSMGEVVQSHALPWITTPDQAMVWGVAFGLDSEVE